ncbi:MAG: universal stress protein [candidate division KSB1 bacterium]|jgi:nucleotide-binding universal stress UspA family protein|nr:universal stress protein [candidate division KSB1 bacterium]
MITLRKILCPLDFSKCSDNALKNALVIAEKYDAELHLFHAILMFEDEAYQNDDRVPDFKQSYDILSEISDAKLSALVKEKSGNIRMKSVSRRGFSASEEILEYAREEDIDLIVVGTHGKSTIRHFLLGSVAEKILRLAQCPVMTVREDTETLGTHNHILIPIDFSEYSNKALAYGLEVASMYGLRVTLMHVIERVNHPSFYGASILEITSRLKKQSLEVMSEIRAKAGFEDVETDYVVKEGKPAHQIVEYAMANTFDLLVIATHGLTGIEHFLMGSTTEKVIQNINVPVLVVKKTAE